MLYTNRLYGDAYDILEAKEWIYGPSHMFITLKDTTYAPGIIFDMNL